MIGQTTKLVDELVRCGRQLRWYAGVDQAHAEAPAMGINSACRTSGGQEAAPALGLLARDLQFKLTIQTHRDDSTGTGMVWNVADRADEKELANVDGQQGA